MSLKAAMQKAEEEANALILAEQNNSTPDGNTEAQETPPSNDGTPKQEAQQPTAPDSVESLKEQLRISEAKYSVLQGKYNAEIKKTPVDVRQYASEIDSLKNQIKQLQTELDAKPSQLESNSDDLDQMIVDEYGEEFAQAIQKMIAKHQSGGNAQDVEQLKQKIDNMERHSQQSARDMQMTTLKTALKAQNIDFEQVDTDPLFHDWLAQEEGTTGQTRQAFLSRNFESGDIQRTAAYYTAFKAQERSSYDKNPLANHVDVSSNHAADNVNEAEVWSQSDIERFYDDVRNNRLTQADIDKYEQSLSRAMQEGRITS